MPLVYAGSAAVPPLPRGSVVAVGNFDGVHLGHRAVLAHVGARAAALGATTVAYTFDPAPTAVVAPSRHQPRITTTENRIRHLGEAGVTLVVVEPFDEAFARLEAERFAVEILAGRLGAKAISVGHDFRFGRGRAGDADALRRWLPEVEVFTVDAVMADGAPISSSRLRKLLRAGDVVAAHALLGRPSTLGGAVVHGDGRGRTIGIPTANIAVREELIPAFGVYAVRLTVGDDVLPGVCNIGVRPTFDGARPSVEVHVLDGAPDLYGQEVEVALLARIREERRFAGVDALVAQIRDDIVSARRALG